MPHNAVVRETARDAVKRKCRRCIAALCAPHCRRITALSPIGPDVRQLHEYPRVTEQMIRISILHPRAVQAIARSSRASILPSISALI